MIKRIILDTNFLLLWKKFKIDIFSEIKRICDFEYNLCVLDKTVDELNKVKMTGYKVALLFIKKYDIEVVKSESSKKFVDDIILDNLNENTILATVDSELKRKAKEKGFSVISLRKGQHLMIEQHE